MLRTECPLPAPLVERRGEGREGGIFCVTMVGKLISYRDENAIAEICYIMAIKKSMWKLKERASMTLNLDRRSAGQWMTDGDPFYMPVFAE